MKRILTDFISLIYPRVCINCNRALISKEEYLCLHCKLNLPLIENNVLNDKLKQTHSLTVPNVSDVFTYLNFNRGGVAQKILHQIKYKGEEALGYMIGEWFGSHISAQVKNKQIDTIIPIPLHKSKHKRRGYNQSEVIANGLGKSLNIPVRTDLLRRMKYTSTQTKLTKINRWVNVDDIFKTTDLFDFKGKHLMLVDDVMTTGATIESAANALNYAGSKNISIACVATGQK